MIATIGRAIIVWWHEMDRWVVPSSVLISRRLPDGWSLARVGDCARVVSNVVKVEPKADEPARAEEPVQSDAPAV